MANELDEMTGPVNEQGRDVNVIEKQIPVKVGIGSTIFEILLWVCGIIPGIIFLIMKINARTYLRQLQQKIQHDASQIDNYLEQRVVILQNAAKLLDKAIDLDKDTMTKVAAYRAGAGNQVDDAQRNAASANIDKLFGQINVAFEQYPDLKAHNEIEQCLQQNSYLQKEITAARELYNDTVYRWNADIQAWPTKMIVAAKAGYTTRIPFSTSAEIKEKAEYIRSLDSDDLKELLSKELEKTKERRESIYAHFLNSNPSLSARSAEIRQEINDYKLYLEKRAEIRREYKKALKENRVEYEKKRNK